MNGINNNNSVTNIEKYASLIIHQSSMLYTPRLWYKKVDVTFAITSYDLGETLQKLNNIDDNM